MLWVGLLWLVVFLLVVVGLLAADLPEGLEGGCLLLLLLLLFEVVV